MLFLQPPFHIIEGVAVFGDHSNERQFYFMPAKPKLTTVQDPTLGIGIPQLQLLTYRRDDDTGGGFLTFEVNLGIDDAQLETIKAELKRIHQLRDEPLLAPVVLESGSVRLMILDRMTAEAPTDGQPPADNATEPSRFVLKINPPHAAKPSLYGDNEAIFSVELTEEAVQLVEASLLQSELLPVGVVYSLDFLALRPAFTVKVDVSWDRVHTQFQESFGLDILFSSVQIDEVIDKLIEERAIVIEVDSFLPEGEDAGSWVGRRDQAINDFKDMILESFFEPSIEPEKEEEDGWDRFVYTTERLSLLAATGGLAGSAKFSYTKRNITDIDQKRMQLRMNERVTVRRSIYPQANLKLGQEVRDLIAQGRLDSKRFIQHVTLDDDWFKTRKVQAHALLDFGYESVDSVNVTLTYGNEPQTLRLTQTGESGSRQWNSIIVNNEMQQEVRYQYRVNFKNVDTAERPGVVTSPLLVTTGSEFEIAPRNEELYFVDEITFGADALPWDRYPSIRVEAKYDDDENDIHLAETFVLTDQHREVTWKRFRLDKALDDYQVRLTFLAADNRDIIKEWITTNEERFTIRNPRPEKRTVLVQPAVSWGLVTTIIVELEYVDEANHVRERQTLSFFNTDQDRNAKTFIANLVNPDHRAVYYSATLVLNDNRVLMVPRSVTAGESIIIRADMLGHRIVAVRPPAIDFIARGILRIEADLVFADANAGLSFADRFTFSSSLDERFFEFDYVAAERNGYNCKMRTVLANGFVQERDLGILKDEKLILPAA